MLDLRTPHRLPLVAPSILSADFGHLADDCRDVLNGGADLLHLDVMDGHFVPNLTMGPALCASLRKAIPDAHLDVHLMVTDPAKFVEPFRKAGANHLTFHAEVMSTAAAISLARTIRDQGMTAGIAINPPTPIEPHMAIFEHVDLILIMSVNPGFSGQAFIPEVLSKTRKAREHTGAHMRVQMDGGITPANVESVREAGCDVIVAATAVFGVPKADRSKAINQLYSRG